VAVVGEAQLNREPSQLGFALSKAVQRKRKPKSQ
jgi:hypothetical protein